HKFHVSLMKAWYGDAAHKDNNYAFEYLPKLDKMHDMLQVFEDMHQGKMNGYFCQGFNPLAASPCKAKVGRALAKLKYLVTIDPLATETAAFWQNHGEYNDVDPAKIQTEVFRLPSTCFAEENGSLVNSGRWLQWHWKGAGQLDGFGQLTDDGKTSCGCWIFAGAWSEKGNLMARRDNSDPSGLGNTLNWAYSWPANRRIQYNRASCDPSGKPWDPNRKLIEWNGTQWAGWDVPDIKLDAAPSEGMNPFIMNSEGVARFFTVNKMSDGPFPEHYEPFESPLAVNPLHPKNPKAKNSPAARVFKDDLDQFGDAEEFPYVATTYRLTEHFHF